MHFLAPSFFCQPVATADVSTLSLHDALPISLSPSSARAVSMMTGSSRVSRSRLSERVSSSPLMSDRKSTRLNSSHEWISYAVFCLKKKSREAAPLVAPLEDIDGEAGARPLRA